ncbi:MAG: hypothetical protein C3F18_07495 [Nitrosomonadales bacterium]|nr:MAG: hypothetical protein C3F18_07495 [Nitrosomonadales bacterium]
MAAFLSKDKFYGRNDTRFVFSTKHERAVFRQAGVQYGARRVKLPAKSPGASAIKPLIQILPLPECQETWVFPAGRLI